MKPPALFHASPDTKIEVFEPRAESVRDLQEGKLVFATADKRVAAMFLVPSTDDWAQKSKFNNDPVAVISDRQRFEQLDKGGAIYSLPPESFKSDPVKGMGESEWVSKEPVRPLGKEVYKSGLQAMLGLGVAVYFVDTETYQKIRSAEDHGFEILSSLKPENQLH